MFDQSLLPENVEFDNLLKVLRKLSWGAADILKAYARGDQPPFGFPKYLNVEEGSEGPVSMADLAVNSWLLNGLEENFPSANWTLLSEETFKKDKIIGKPVLSEWLWILDPLDGTKDFLQGTHDYAVHLALVKNQKPVLGVVLIPELSELWFGVQGCSSWCEDRNSNEKVFELSKRSNLSDLILVTSRNHRERKLEKLIQELSLKNIKTIGSIGCKIATILRGEADIYLTLSGQTAPKDWDIAAPEIVLNSAGGLFTYADQNPIYYNTGDISKWGCLIASNGLIHKNICDLVMNKLSIIDSDLAN